MNEETIKKGLLRLKPLIYSIWNDNRETLVNDLMEFLVIPKENIETVRETVKTICNVWR